MELYNQNINLPKIELTKKNRQKTEYINLSCSFDIETTSYQDKDIKYGFMYIWQFGIKNEDYIYYGRTWENFIELCQKLKSHYELSENRILICYIHNLSFEFQFMRKYISWIDVFCVDDRKPIKALSNFYIEFRDSYILSAMSLSNLAKNLTSVKINKLIGNLDYSLIRHSKTDLTAKELQYCEYDIKILLYYINEQISLYGDISKIPLTNTGRVRRQVRFNCYYTNKSHKKTDIHKYQKYRTLMSNLTITPIEYKQLKNAFCGGFTHSNSNYTGEILTNITSFDFTSSYPYVMLSEKYPMSKGQYIKLSNEKNYDYYNQRYLLVFNIQFINLRPIVKYENYISAHKCSILESAILNNGRVFSASKLQTTITNIDFDIIKVMYKWDKCFISDIIAYKKSYLPKSIIESILDFYEKKTTLKGIKNKENEYMINKFMLNSIYGMSVTDNTKDSIKYNDEKEWYIEPIDVDKSIDEYNNSKNRFLFYPWGIFVTAYARKNLFSGIVNCGDDYIYADTDSIKILNYNKHKDYFEKYNKKVELKLSEMCQFYKIDFNRCKPRNIKGIEKLIGIWEYEDTYNHFKTLGAKRYLTESKGELHLTVAGLSKQTALKYMLNICNNDVKNVFNMFNDNLYIPSDYTDKNTHYYIDNEFNITITDYQNKTIDLDVKSGIYMEKCDFTLNVAKEYNNFIQRIKNGIYYIGNENV